MAVQGPINYGIDVAPLNPAQQIMQGMSVGQGLLDAREQGLQRQQAAEMRPLQMQQAQLGLRTGLTAEADANANRAMQQAAAQSASMRQAAMQEAMQKYLQNPTPEEANAFFTQFPEHPLAKQFDKVIASRTEQQREQDFSRSMQVTSALEAKNPDAAIRFLEAEADKFAGVDEQQAKGLRQTAEMVRKDPKQTLAYLQGLQSKLAPSLGKSLEELRGVDAKVREGVAKAEVSEAESANIVAKLAAELGVTKAKAAEIWKNINLGERGMQLKEMEAADKSAGGEEKGKPLEAAAVKEIGTAQAALDSLDSILVRKKGVDTGPIAAFLNEKAQTVGVDDPEVTALRAELGNVVNEIINTLSGAAVSESEFARIRQGLPQFDDNDRAFVTKVKATRARVQRALDNALKANKASGRDVSGFDGTTEDAWSQLPKAG